MTVKNKIKQLQELTCKINVIEQRRLAKNNNKFVLDYNIDGLLVTDKNLLIEFCNPALLELLGYEQEALIGKDITYLMNDDDKKKHILETIKNKIIENRIRDNMCKSDSYKICEDVVGNIINSNGEKIQVLISVGEIVTQGIQQFICIIRKTNDER